MNLLLDTCALLWLTSDLEALSPKAVEAIKKNPGGLCVSAISAFEIAIKVKKGHIKLPQTPSKWFARALAHHGLTEVPVSAQIAAASVALPSHHSDPCDRIIVATAAHLKSAILTPDKLIREYKSVRVIW